LHCILTPYNVSVSSRKLVGIFLFAHPFGAYTEKNGFVTVIKLGTTNKFFVAAPKNFAAATKPFVDRTKHFVVVTQNIFVIPILRNDFVGITKPFIPCKKHWR